MEDPEGEELSAPGVAKSVAEIVSAKAKEAEEEKATKIIGFSLVL